MASKYAANTDHAFLKLTNSLLGIYNLHDCHETAKLVHPLLQELTDNGQLPYYLNNIEPLQRPVIAMAKRGLLVDKQTLRETRMRIAKELEETDAVVVQADPTGRLGVPTGRSPNSIGSTKVLREFLFSTLGLRASKKTETELDSTDQEALFRILRDLRKRDELSRPILEALFHRSRLRTLFQRYLTFDIDPDGRVRAQVKMHGTKTWRFAYAKPALQQFPQELWSVFRAKPGHLFLAADYSQLEAKLLAYLSGDSESIGVFESGGDVHTENAIDLLGELPLDEGGKAPKPERGFAKTFLYGLSYGGAVETMKMKLFCPCPRCEAQVPPVFKLSPVKMKAAERRWFQKHHAVRKFQRDTAEFIRRHNYYESPVAEGARRYFAAPWSKDLDREAKNLPMQFGGAIIMNASQVRLHAIGAPIVLQRHDEFMLEIPSSPGRVVDQWVADVRGIMEEPIVGLGGVSFNVDVEAGESWGELKAL
jgi:DNA polymerase-1